MISCRSCQSSSCYKPQKGIKIDLEVFILSFCDCVRRISHIYVWSKILSCQTVWMSRKIASIAIICPLLKVRLFRKLDSCIVCWPRGCVRAYSVLTVWMSRKTHSINCNYLSSEIGKAISQTSKISMLGPFFASGSGYFFWSTSIHRKNRAKKWPILKILKIKTR